jgi:hypothetical protein
MSIILFAIIGANIKAGAGYWIIFAAFCTWEMAKCIAKFIDN